MASSFIQKHFIGISAHELSKVGYDPAQQIVPLWFGFRTELTAAPERCEIEVTGRSQFKLFVNGESILFGPCRGAREVAYFDTIDIAPWLRAGENRIAMQVFSYPEQTSHTTGENGPNYCFGDSSGPAISLTGELGSCDPADPANWRVWVDNGQRFNNYQIFLLGSNESVDGSLALENPFFRPEWDESATLPAEIVQPVPYDGAGGAKCARK